MVRHPIWNHVSFPCGHVGVVVHLVAGLGVWNPELLGPLETHGEPRHLRGWRARKDASVHRGSACLLPIAILIWSVSVGMRVCIRLERWCVLRLVQAIMRNVIVFFRRFFHDGFLSRAIQGCFSAQFRNSVVQEDSVGRFYGLLSSISNFRYLKFNSIHLFKRISRMFFHTFIQFSSKSGKQLNP